jgi:hypothetical protein
VCNAVDNFLEDEFSEVAQREHVRDRAERILREGAESGSGLADVSEEVRQVCVRVLERGLEADIRDLSVVLGTIEEVRKPLLEGGLTTTVSNEVKKLRETLKDFLDTDTICFRVPPGRSASDVSLRRKQDRAYEPLLEWFTSRFGTSLQVMEGFEDKTQSEEVFVVAEDFVDRADHFTRAALSSLLGVTKSGTIALALLFQHISLDQALEAARVEEDFQIEENGFVEDGHDTQRIQGLVRASAAASLMRLLPESSPANASGSFAAARRGAGMSFTGDETMEERIARTRLRRLFDVAEQERQREEAARAFEAMIRARGWEHLTPEELEGKLLEDQFESISQQRMMATFDGGDEADRSNQ